MRRTMAILAGIILAATLTSGVGATRQGLGTVPDAERTFMADTFRLDTFAYWFMVQAYDSSFEASLAMSFLPATVRQVPEAAVWPATRLPLLMQDVQGYTGTLDVDGTALPIGLLVVRDGRYLHLWLAAAFAGRPYDDLCLLAERFFAHGGASAPLTLADRLPSEYDLPPGFTEEPGAGSPLDV